MVTFALIFWLSSQSAIFSSRTHFVRPSPPALISQTFAIPKGQVVEKVVCESDPDQSYALYLPSYYSPKQKWPVLYAFDPGARGKVPVERFKDAAEQFGWIIVGSNNSRNGALQPSVNAWKSILNDTQNRLAIDDQRAYLTGLSGGARLAIYFATRCQGCIVGVIACAAGFPVGITPSPSLHFSIFSTTGVDDFNFAEVKSLDEALTKAGMTHQIEVFAGRHEWPPASVATAALEWLELQAMKTGKRQRNEKMIEATWQRKLQQARLLEESKKTYDAYQIYSELVESFKDLHDVGEAERRSAQLRGHSDVRSAIREEQRQVSKQREIQDGLSGLMGPAQRSIDEASGDNRDSNSEPIDPETRLQAMLMDLRKQAGRTEDTGDRRVARRVLDGVFIGLFEQGTNQLQSQKRYAAAIRTFTRATEVNPDRAGAFFYLAWAYAANRDKQKALRALRTAVDKGFSDLSAIASNKAFDLVRDDAQYQQIIRAMQSKH